MVRTQLWFDPIVNPQTLQIQLFWTLRPANIAFLHIHPRPHTHTHPPTPHSTPNRQWNVNDLNSLMLMSSMLMLVVLMWWYLSCPAKITLWAFTCWPSSQARVTSAKSLSFLKFLIVQLCHSYWPNVSSEKYEELHKDTTIHFTGIQGVLRVWKSRNLGVQDSGSPGVSESGSLGVWESGSLGVPNHEL